MAKTTKETLKVSDCHHGGLEEVKIGTVDDKGNKYLRATGAYICAICKQPCKVVELLEEYK